MMLLGLALAASAPTTSSARRASPSGINDLGQGVEFLPVAMGLFGIAEVMLTAVEKDELGQMIRVRMRDLLPNA